MDRLWHNYGAYFTYIMRWLIVFLLFFPLALVLLFFVPLVIVFSLITFDINGDLRKGIREIKRDFKEWDKEFKEHNERFNKRG